MRYIPKWSPLFEACPCSGHVQSSTRGRPPEPVVQHFRCTQAVDRFEGLQDLETAKTPRDSCHTLLGWVGKLTTVF